MVAGDPGQPRLKITKGASIAASIAACLLFGGCAQGGGEVGSGMFAAIGVGADAAESAPQDPQKAVEHWGKEYSQDPRDLDKALSYAQSLKTTGQKSQALVVLQQASLLHGSDRRLASDYGRLALELDQVGVAKRLLEAADDPANPDWRVIMARGTVLAKEAKYTEAISFYERALAFSPDHPSVMNNLALAYTMSGDAAKAEALLRRAAEANGANAKVRQNLALVLGLQGKYDEAVKVGSLGLPEDSAKANTDLLRQIVKLEPKAEPSSTWSTQATPEAAAEVAAVWNADVLEGNDAGAATPATPPAKPTAATTPTVASTQVVATGAGLLSQWPHIGGGEKADGTDLAPLLVQ